MTTVINNPSGNSEGSDTAMGLIVGIAVLVLAALFFIYALPAIRNSTPPKDTNVDVNVQLPTPQAPTPLQNPK